MGYMGLSPRLRGNAEIPMGSAPSAGSIPALAGERELWALEGVIVGVYPRACGGTYLGRPEQVPVEGLSPRLRGNAGMLATLGAALGSIPALAGERFLIAPACCFVRVYPRACGGTQVEDLTGYREMGLSPRLRGNVS